MQDPEIVAPLDWKFAPEVLVQLPQNIAIEVSFYDPSS
jgi:hypothetical protein